MYVWVYCINVFIPCTIATYVQCLWEYVLITLIAVTLTNIDPHEYRGEVLAKWVVLEVVKQRVCSPLNARGHDKEDLWRQGRGQVRRVERVLDDTG